MHAQGIEARLTDDWSERVEGGQRTRVEDLYVVVDAAHGEDGEERVRARDVDDLRRLAEERGNEAEHRAGQQRKRERSEGREDRVAAPRQPVSSDTAPEGRRRACPSPRLRCTTCPPFTSQTTSRPLSQPVAQKARPPPNRHTVFRNVLTFCRPCEGAGRRGGERRGFACRCAVRRGGRPSRRREGRGCAEGASHLEDRGSLVAGDLARLAVRPANQSSAGGGGVRRPTLSSRGRRDHHREGWGFPRVLRGAARAPCVEDENVRATVVARELPHRAEREAWAGRTR